MFFRNYFLDLLDPLDPFLPLEVPTDGLELLEELEAPEDFEELIELVFLDTLLPEAEEDFFELLLFFTDALFE